MLLVMTNSTQRELTDWEKVMQHMKLKEIIPKLKKRQGLDGRARTLEADYLGVSEAQIAIYNTIGTKLDAWLMSIFKDGSIGISLAYEAAKLEPEEQRQLVQISTVNGIRDWQHSWKFDKQNILSDSTHCKDAIL